MIVVMPRAIEALERDFSAWLGVPDTVATGYGRSAAYLAIHSLTRRIDSRTSKCEVLVPNLICRQIPDAVRLAGAEVRYYRVPRDLVIRPEHLHAMVTSQTRAAIVPHFFGRVQPLLADLARTCRELGIVLVEDCALALGAITADGHMAGACGGMAIFSFTKSDWCYGGGLLTARDPLCAQHARLRVTSEFANAARSAWDYGLLRRADFASNRPSRARAAEFVGRWVERVCGMRGRNFFDFADFHCAMSMAAARRARRVLRELPTTISRRRQILAALYEALRDTPLLFRPQPDSGDTGSFLLLCSTDGAAARWRELAAEAGVTLRLIWPAYQELEPAQGSPDLSWLASHLLLMEIHPELSTREIHHIVGVLKRLAGTA